MDLVQIYKRISRNPLLQGITLTGGQPFQQAADCVKIAQYAHYRGLDVWCYTGYTLEQLKEHGSADQKDLLKNIDVLVDGPFDIRQRTLELPWRGSRNQRIIRMNQEI